MAIEFIVEMKDQVSGAAKKALASLTGLESKAKGLSGGMASAMGPLGASALSAEAQIKTLKGALGSLERSHVKQLALGGDPAKIAATESSIGKLKSALAGIAPEAKAGAAGVESIGAAGAEAAGPIGMIVAAYVAMGTVIAGVVVEGAKLALEMSEGREKTVAMFDALGNGKVSGEKALKVISDLAETLPQTRGELKGWAKDLMSAGVTDMSKLQNQLTAIASAEALMGEDGAAAAEKVKNLFAKISEASQMGTKLKVNEKMFQGIGVSAEDVAKKLGVPADKLKAMLKTGEVDAKKFGAALEEALIEKGKGPLEVMSGSLSSMKAKFVENIMAMFSGVNVKPFLGELKKMGSLFSTSSAQGKEMKGAVTSFFNAVFSVATAVLPVVAMLLRGVVTAGLFIVKVMRPIGAAFAWMFRVAGGAAMLKTVMKGLVVILVMLAAVALVAVSPFLLIFAAIAAVVGVVIAIVAATSAAIGAIINFASAADTALVGWAQSAVDAAGNFISGLVGGISSGAGAVVDAMKNLATSAVGAFKSAMGISSPSKVMMKMGEHTTAGLGDGVDQGAPKVAAAGKDLAGSLVGGVNSPGTAPGSDASGAGAPGKAGKDSKGKGGVTITVEKGAIVVSGSGDVSALTEEAIALLFERLALESGLGAT